MLLIVTPQKSQFGKFWGRVGSGRTETPSLASFGVTCVLAA